MSRNRLIAVAALAAVALAPLPAAARDGSRLAEKMRDPQLQDTMAAAVRALSEALLDMPLAPFARAMEAMGDREARNIDPDATLGDVAGPEARRMPEEVSRRLPAMMGAMGEMAGTLEAALPAMKEVAREMGARMGEAVAGAGRADDRDEPQPDEAIPSAQQE